MSREFVVRERAAHQRLDQYLTASGVAGSRTFLQKLIRSGAVRVNGRTAKPSYTVRAGDQIAVEIPAPTPLEIRPEPIPLEIVFEDPHLLVINKPPGLVVHPAPGHYSGTLVHALLYHCRDLSGIGGRERPGIVHRLDKGTSGLLLVAKTDEAHRALSKQFSSHSVRRSYQALVWGCLKKKSLRVDLAIGRDRRERKKISPRTNRPKPAATTFSVIERFSSATWVEAVPQTGRTHQIRVHLSSLGHPVLGDGAYGGRKVLSFGDLRIERPMLHAYRLGFIHPATGKPLEWTASLPEDMAFLIRKLRSGGSTI